MGLNFEGKVYQRSLPSDNGSGTQTEPFNLVEASATWNVDRRLLVEEILESKTDHCF